MDNLELYSRVRELESELRQAKEDSRDGIFRIWLVMLVGVQLVAMFGLSVVRAARVESIQEVRRQIAGLQLKPSAPKRRVGSGIVR